MGVKNLALFIVFAVPGALLFVFASIYLTAQFFDKRLESQFAYPILLSTLGAGATLVGLRKLREWKYIFVFLSFPLSLLISAGIVRVSRVEALALPLLILSFLAPFFVSKVVRDHYAGTAD